MTEDSRLANSLLILLCAMSKDPFSHFDFDGVLGLGLESLALSAPANGMCLWKSPMPQCFSRSRV